MLLHTARGREALVAVAKDRKADDVVRIAVLESASTRPDLAGEILAPRIAELMFDTDAVRRRRAELRKSLKAPRSGDS